ncbi:MAG: RNA methyltransferase [Candidatus Bathyarchaeia archaeon]|nr:RNA methyltransferase [Candidatus Bathyarchaeia archaeon]
MQRKKLSIAIPASIVSDTPHLREKTSKIGLIGRVAAIFRVDEIMIYPDNPKVNQVADMDLTAVLLAYMETPQYLRKRLFKLKPELRYVGILPPLRTPHHPLNRRMKNLKVGEYREGVAVSKTKKGMLVDIGVEQPALIPNRRLPIDRRVTVRIIKVDKRVEVELANRGEIPEYWGYTVTVERHPFGKMVKNRGFDLTIATSKYGVPFADIAERIAEKWRSANNILVGFGAPTQGLYEIVGCEGLNLNDVVDFVVNTIPMQGTETIRTEEALIASLAVLNRTFAFKI